MALYLNFTFHAPSLPNVPIDYDSLLVYVKAYTTPDFQPDSQRDFTITAASFSTDVSLTGSVYDAWGDIPNGVYYTLGVPQQNIDGPLNYSTTYYFQATVTGQRGEDEAEATSDVFEFTTEESPDPGQPTTPTPTNNDTEVDFSGFVLSWVTGGNTDSYNVWVGPSGSLVEVSHGQVGTSYTTNIDEVPLNQKIYWRVDATNASGTIAGNIWNFDARPAKATTPTPGNTDTEVDFSDFTISWADGGNTDSYDVWIGDSDNLYLCYEEHTETSYISNWDELITNGNFSDWSFGEPDDWTVRRDFFTQVLQCGDNEGHYEATQSDSGYGLCNIYNSHLFGDTVDVYQYVTLEVGKRYALSIEINRVVTGELTIWAGADGVDLDETVDSAAIYTWTFRATSETELIAIKSLARTDITIDNVSVILNEIPYDEVIYWEIDAVNEFGTTDGSIWTFDPRPGQVSTFTPLADATDLTLSEIGSTWVSPSDNTDYYDVYFGLESEALFFVGDTVGLLLDLVSVFPFYDYTYYWAIDAVNIFGVTTGAGVSFTTMAFLPPLPTGMNLDGTGTPTGENNMITIRKLVVAANNKIWVEDI